MDTIQIVLFVGILLMAATTIASLVWALRLNSKAHHRPLPKHYDVHIAAEKVFSLEELGDIGHQAALELEKITGESAKQLQAALTAVVAGLANKTEDMTNGALAQEFEKFHTSFAALREQTIKEFNDMHAQLDTRRSQMSEELEVLVAKDREERMTGFNARLDDVVSSYIVESLGKNVDLGAQSAYILAILEQHKEDIKKDLLA